MSAFKQRRRLVVSALVALSIVALGSAVGAYGYYARGWGCPSAAEVNRPRTPDEILTAFADRDLDLVPAPVSVAVPQGARTYRYVTSHASLYVLVCEASCSGGPPNLSATVFTSGSGERQRMRAAIDVLNVFLWTTDADNRSGQRLLTRVRPVVDEALAPPDDNRCFPS